MSFQPALPALGYAGWKMLDRTRPAQQAAFDRQPIVKRDDTYFREKIGSIASAEELVADRRLLKVALGAFGLEADIDNRFFIRKVLEEGTLTPGALALKLSDKRYQAFSSAFGFGDFATPRNKLSDFADRMIASWRDRQFEAAVGTVDENLRLALNARRELSALAAKTQSEDAKWFALMGQPPLRQVVEVALGLPSSLGRLDVDKQREVFRDKASRVLGDDRIGQFAGPDRMEMLLRRFLLRAEAAQNVQMSVRGSGALALLQSMAASPPMALTGR